MTMTASENVAVCMSDIDERDPRIMAAVAILDNALCYLDYSGDLVGIAPDALWEIYLALLENDHEIRRNRKARFCSTGKSWEDIAYLCTLDDEAVDPWVWTIADATTVIESTFNCDADSYPQRALHALQELDHIFFGTTSTVSHRAPVQASPA